MPTLEGWLQTLNSGDQHLPAVLAIKAGMNWQLHALVYFYNGGQGCLYRACNYRRSFVPGKSVIMVLYFMYFRCYQLKKASQNRNILTKIYHQKSLNSKKKSSLFVIFKFVIVNSIQIFFLSECSHLWRCQKEQYAQCVIYHLVQRYFLDHLSRLQSHRDMLHGEWKASYDLCWFIHPRYLLHQSGKQRCKSMSFLQ